MFFLTKIMKVGDDFQLKALGWIHSRGKRLDFFQYLTKLTVTPGK
jgi:hypothetical protein